MQSRHQQHLWFRQISWAFKVRIDLCLETLVRERNIGDADMALFFCAW